MIFNINPAYIPITEKAYCCVPAVLQMVQKRRNLPILSQDEIGWQLGLIVPKEKAHFFKKARTGKMPSEGWGTQTSKKSYSLNNYFKKNNLPLLVNIYNYIEIKNVVQFFTSSLQANKDIIVCYNSKILFGDGDNEHVSLIQQIDRKSLTIIDPALGAPKVRKTTLSLLILSLIKEKSLWVISEDNN